MCITSTVLCLARLPGWHGPWYMFEHKGCSSENIPNGNSFGPEHFLPEHHWNTVQGPDNHVRCHEFRSLQMMVLVLFLLVECV